MIRTRFLTSNVVHTRAIAYFISPHGFGHASRAAAVMNALHEKIPAVHFEIFTLVPHWFFRESLTASFTYHTLLTDIGLAQETSLREDIPQTLKRLKEFLPFDRALVSELGQRVTRLNCKLIVCDIAPLGIAVARAAGIPSVLVENFTWDWIYAGYAKHDSRFNKHIKYLRAIFRSADYHIQTEPVCDYWRANLSTPPVSREPRTSRKEIRKRLEIPQHAKTVLITMGGIPERHSFIEQLTQVKRVHFIIPGASQSIRIQANLILLPHRSKFYHPDLMNAADVVIGKAGYSTVAEAYHAGIPLGYIQRDKFRESKPMAVFIQKQMRGIEIPATRFKNEEWLAVLPNLLNLPRIKRRKENGAGQVADFMLELIR